MVSAAIDHYPRILLDLGKNNVLGVLVDGVDYEAAVNHVVDAARAGEPYGVSPLAVHGVMTGVLGAEQRHRLNSLELVTPDGQPVRWALRLLHGHRLPDRVYGPALMSRLLAAAEASSLPVFFFGSSEEVLDALERATRRRHPEIVIAGSRSSRFREMSATERDELVNEIQRSGARMTFVGLGCPRQEVFVFELRERLEMPTVAVGAAFDYHAGTLKEPPAWVQSAGLQWLYRLLQNPRRLWRRYVLLNPAFLMLVGLQASRLWRPDTRGTTPRVELRPG